MIIAIMKLALVAAATAYLLIRKGKSVTKTLLIIILALAVAKTVLYNIVVHTAGIGTIQTWAASISIIDIKCDVGIAGLSIAILLPEELKALKR